MALATGLLMIAGCDKESDDAVDRGLELKALFLDAYCEAASDASCATDEATCAFQPYDSVDSCESKINVSFQDCPNLWVPLSEEEDAVLACVEALGAMTCDASGLCDEDGFDIFPLPECEIVADLQGLWCEGADTF